MSFPTRSEGPVTKMMTVREVAAYLNIKERKVYDLVRRGTIPASRVAGKWLFPQDLVDAWVARGAAEHSSAGRLRTRGSTAAPAPPVVAGSHDPLLEWSLRESACGLALMPGGSLDGLRRLAAGEAQVCGTHVLDVDSGAYNVPAVHRTLGHLDVVLLEWAWRRQGLVTAPDNPLGLREPAHLLAAPDGRRPRFIVREADAGTHVLLAHLLAREGLDPAGLDTLPEVARSQTDVGLAVLEGRADAGLAVEAVARQLRLGFVPLHRERYDLCLRRRDYFEPAFQRLLAFLRTDAYTERAAALGYDIAGQGTVHYNAP